MRRLLYILTLLIFSAQNTFATHQRAAEITYKHIEGLTYEFTIIMFTRTSSPADDTRTVMPIIWGDGTSDEIPRIDFYDIGDDISFNRYVGRHTFPAPGSYVISVEDPNRNNGVVNIPNSVNVPMYIESYLVINPFLGYNNSVQLLNPPIDAGCVGKTFIHNPAAYDPDGDSLSYKLVICKGAGGQDIPGYTFPLASRFFKIDSVSGDMIWKNPVLQGEYNVAFVVSEWRAGTLIGYVRRDMQINIVTCDHDPPAIETIDDTCVTAGDTLDFFARAWDPEGTNVTLSAFGGPFEQSVSPAMIYPDPATGDDTVTTQFLWITKCTHIRKKSYSVTFKARDSGFPVNLVNFKTVNITVNAPAPENLTAEPLGNGINLSWKKTKCENAQGYLIYRKSDVSGWEPGYCETGVPAYTGYKLIEKTEGRDDTTYRDENGGDGLVHGIKYCYRVTAWFVDDAESYASNEACASLKRDVPIITHVSNIASDLTSGHVFIDWAKPTELDTIQYPGPYKYVIYRNNGLTWNAPEKIATLQGLDNTVYHDNEINLNNNDAPFSYRIDLESGKVGYIAGSHKASSIYLQIQPFDKTLKLFWAPEVPWINSSFVIYRKMPGNNTFDSIGTTPANFYFDRNLDNDAEYCYYIKSIGAYSLPGLPSPLINYSQIACGVPNDYVPPCPPSDTATTNCQTLENTLKLWMPPTDSCFYDLEKYLIYFAKPGGELQLIDSVWGNHADTVYYLHKGLESIVGCYSAKAVDSVGNVSDMGHLFCVNWNACPQYDIPNVFTPNGDGINDVLVPFYSKNNNPKANVDHIDMVIFNRWGNIVFETNDPMINWDGKNQKNNRDCPEGVYYYTCYVYVITTNGLQREKLQGSVTIIK
jgi:gliding motility-associated-like protein